MCHIILAHSKYLSTRILSRAIIPPNPFRTPHFPLKPTRLKHTLKTLHKRSRTSIPLLLPFKLLSRSRVKKCILKHYSSFPFSVLSFLPSATQRLKMPCKPSSSLPHVECTMISSNLPTALQVRYHTTYSLPSVSRAVPL
jgi:hypothetical protein